MSESDARPEIRWERLLKGHNSGINICRFCGCATKQGREGVRICPTCGREYLDDFARVRKYLEENGEASILQIATATGVDSASISSFLQDGRVQLADNSKAFLSCVRCGAPIKSGKICVACSRMIDKKNATELEKEYLDAVGERPAGLQAKGGARPKAPQRKGPAKEGLIAPVIDGEWVLGRDDRGSQLIVDLKDKVERQVQAQQKRQNVAGFVPVDPAS